MGAKRKSIRGLEAACLSIRKDILDLATREVMHAGGDLFIADVVIVSGNIR